MYLFLFVWRKYFPSTSQPNNVQKYKKKYLKLIKNCLMRQSILMESPASLAYNIYVILIDIFISSFSCLAQNSTACNMISNNFSCYSEGFFLFIFLPKILVHRPEQTM